MDKFIKEKSVIETGITAVTNDGSGVSRYNGMVVFTPFTAVGDKAEISVEKVGKNCIYGELAKIIEPSPSRIKPDCKAFGECGGCALRHIDYPAEAEIKTQWVKDHIERIGGLNAEVLPVKKSPKTDGYRNKAIYQAGTDEDGKIVFGFYKRKSHEVINCENCRLQPPEFAEILRAIKFFVNERKITVYDERSNKGLLRAVYIRKGEISGETGVCLIINGNKLPDSELLVSVLKNQFESIVSIVLNVNTERTNAVLGRKFITVFGKDGITDTLCKVKIDISPAAFYQVNHNAAELLYKEAESLAELTGKETLLDLYCGAGTIGLSMANKVKSLIGVEIVPEAVINAKRNAEQNGIKNAEFICADAEKAAENLKNRGIRPDVVILDPPRKGCSEDTIAAVAAMEPKKIVMISCNTATMARDLKMFDSLGYVCKTVQPVDMFPRTANCEAVAGLYKKN